MQADYPDPSIPDANARKHIIAFLQKHTREGSGARHGATLTDEDVELVVSPFVDEATSNAAVQWASKALAADQVRGLVDILYTHRGSGGSTGAARWSAIANLVDRYMRIVPLEGTTPASWRATPLKSHSDVLAALQYAFDRRVPESCPTLLRRLIDPPDEVWVGAFFDEYLIPLVPRLRSFLIRQGVPLSSPLFAPTFRDIMLRYVEAFLRLPTNWRTIPAVSVKDWTCTMPECVETRKWIRGDPPYSSLILLVGERRRRHLVKELKTHTHGVCAWGNVGMLGVVGFRVWYEPRNVWHRQRWVLRQKQGMALLKSISADVAELRALATSTTSASQAPSEA